MMDNEVFYENYYLDEEEIISYIDMNKTLYSVIKSNEMLEKCAKYLDEVVKK